MYRRETRELPFPSLPRHLIDALTSHAEARQLSLDRVRTWITHSENPPGEGLVARLLGRRANPVDPDPEHDTVIVLHPTHVLVATSGPKRGTAVLSLPLALASLSEGSAIASRLVVAGSHDGFTLEGFPGEVGRPGTHFVGVGAGPDGAACTLAVKEAIRVTKSGR